FSRDWSSDVCSSDLTGRRSLTRCWRWYAAMWRRMARSRWQRRVTCLQPAASSPRPLWKNWTHAALRGAKATAAPFARDEPAAASTPETGDQVDDNGQHHADQQHRPQRGIECEVIALDADIPRKLAQPGDASRQKHDQSRDEQDAAQDHQPPSHVKHVRLLASFLFK